MPWNILTSDQVLTPGRGLSPNEIAFIQSNLGGANAASQVLANLLADEIASAQGGIIAGGSQQGPVGTIPDQLRPDIITIVIWRLLNSYPALKALQTDFRKAAYQDAREKMDNVANGKIKIELPSAGTAQTNPAPVNAVETVRPGRRVFTHEFDKLGNT
jgi:Protein of unknown function (DUF1320)